MIKKPELKNGIARRMLKRLAEADRRHRRRIGRILFFTAILYIGYLFCSGDYGLFRIYRLTKQRNELQQEYMSITSESVYYLYNLRRLKTDPHFIEWLARTQYGYSRPGDIIYHIQPTEH
jgi:cell division protein FtsB